MVPRIFGRGKEPEKKVEKEKMDPRIAKITGRDVGISEKKALLDRIFREEPELLTNPRVLGAVTSEKDLVRHVILQEYHVKMGDISYGKLKEALKRAFLQNPDDALDLLIDIARTNLKRRESIERTLDVFSDVFRAATANITPERARKFAQAYGLLRKRIDAYTGTNKEFVKRLLVMLGQDLSNVLLAAAKHHADLAKNAETEEEFRKHYNTYHGLAKEALFVLQKTMKHADRDLVRQYHGTEDRFVMGVRKVLKNLWHDVELSVDDQTSKKILERVNIATKAINRGIQNGILDEKSAAQVLTELAANYGPAAENGLLIILRNTKDPNLREKLVQSYLKELEKHLRGFTYARHASRFAGRIKKELKDPELALFVKNIAEKRVKMHR